MKYFPGARVNHIVNKYLNVYLLRHFWLRKNVRETFTQFQTQNDAGNVGTEAVSYSCSVKKCS